MAFDWKSLVASVAPSIATALGGPLAGMAIKAVGDAIGLSAPTEDTVSAALANATPDQLAAIKKADQDFAVKMESLGIDLERIQAADRDSARKMQINMRSSIVPMLSCLIVFMTIGCEAWLLFSGQKPVIDDIVLGRIMGTLDAALLIVLNFYFGSSSQSHMQTRLLGDKAK
jgi:hypothetical protein